MEVVGIYLDPPEQALVLSRGEQSQPQALDRTRKNPPMFAGRLNRIRHDSTGNGTTTLLTAEELAEGWIISECMLRERHQGRIQFLKKIDVEKPPGLDLHLIVDRYASLGHPR